MSYIRPSQMTGNKYPVLASLIKEHFSIKRKVWNFLMTNKTETNLKLLKQRNKIFKISIYTCSIHKFHWCYILIFSKWSIKFIISNKRKRQFYLTPPPSSSSYMPFCLSQEREMLADHTEINKSQKLCKICASRNGSSVSESRMVQVQY